MSGASKKDSQDSLPVDGQANKAKSTFAQILNDDVKITAYSTQLRRAAQSHKRTQGKRTTHCQLEQLSGCACLYQANIPAIPEFPLCCAPLTCIISDQSAYTGLPTLPTCGQQPSICTLRIARRPGARSAQVYREEGRQRRLVRTVPRSEIDLYSSQKTPFAVACTALHPGPASWTFPGHRSPQPCQLQGTVYWRYNLHLPSPQVKPGLEK